MVVAAGRLCLIKILLCLMLAKPVHVYAYKIVAVHLNAAHLSHIKRTAHGTVQA